MFFIFKLNASFHLSVTYILSLSIHFFYIMYNPIIVIENNYFVLRNDFHITGEFKLIKRTSYIAASPDEILMASLQISLYHVKL